MALSAFKLHTRRGQAQLHFSDGRGRDFEGQAVMPIVAFASELVAEIASRRRGALRDFCVDLSRGELRATVDGHGGEIEVVHIDGREFESKVRPSSVALIEWAEIHFGGALVLEPDWS